jgi:hypothetical protein
VATMTDDNKEGEQQSPAAVAESGGLEGALPVAGAELKHDKKEVRPKMAKDKKGKKKDKKKGKGKKK